MVSPRLCMTVLVLGVGLALPCHTSRAEEPLLDQDGDELPPGALARLGPKRWLHHGTESLAFSPDGKLLATGGIFEVRLQETATGKRVRSISVPEPKRPKAYTGMTLGDAVASLAFSPDGKRLAAAAVDNECGKISILETRDGAPVFVLEDDSISRSIAFSHDGAVVASAHEDGKARFWDAMTGKLIREVAVGEAAGALAFLPDGKVAVGCRDGAVSIVDAARAVPERVLVKGGPGPAVRSLAISPDGKSVVVGDGRVRLLGLATGEEIRTLAKNGSMVESLAFSPDGRVVAAACDGTLLAWHTATGEALANRRASDDQAYRAVGFSKDGTLAVAGREVRTFHLPDMRPLQPVERHWSWIDALAFSPDGKLLASGSLDASMVFELSTGKAVLHRAETALPGSQGGPAVAFSPDGSTALMNGDLVLVPSGKLVRRLEEAPPQPQRAEFSPDGKAVVLLDRGIHVFDVASGKRTRKLEAGNDSGARQTAALSADGARYASAGKDGTVRVRNTATGEVCASLAGGAPVAFSPDGKLVTTVELDQFQGYVVRLWDVASGKLAGTIKSYPGSVVFSPDGKVLAAFSHTSATVSFFDVSDGHLLRAVETGDWVCSLVFSPDGGTFATGHRDTTVLLWKTPGP